MNTPAKQKQTKRKQQSLNNFGNVNSNVVQRKKSWAQILLQAIHVIVTVNVFLYVHNPNN